MDLTGTLGKLITGVLAGIAVGVFYAWRLKHAEQDRLELSDKKNWIQADLDAKLHEQKVKQQTEQQLKKEIKDDDLKTW